MSVHVWWERGLRAAISAASAERGKGGGLTGVAAGEAGLSQAPLELLGVHLAVLRRAGSDTFGHALRLKQ